MYSPTYNSGVSHPSSLSRPRPWSPDPTDPLPPVRSFGGQLIRTSQAYDNGTSATHPYPGHDTSDPSIDALDLADYARTFNLYPIPTHPTYDDYSLPPPPRSISVTSRASLNPPSLVSSRGTSTSQSHSKASRHTNHRSFLPAVPSSLAQPSVYTPPDNALYSPNILHHSLDTASARGGVANSEIDISQFPAWSRGWYTKDSKSPNSEAPSEASRAPFFDPSYRTTAFPGNNYDLYAGTNSTSSRDWVPWSNTDIPHHDFPLDPELKEERIRMLEHEFRENPDAPTKEEPLGSVDEHGRLITDGPKKRMAIRVVEFLFAFGIASSLIYAALWIKTPHPPPPQSEPHTFALYALSILTSLFFLYRFLFRPCCCAGRRKKRDLTSFGPSGLAVLPVQGLSGDEKKKKKGKKGKQEQGNVQVNLIVDPTMFRSPLDQDDEEDANLDEHSSSTRVSQSGTSRRPKRRSIFEGLAIEEQWRAARKELKWMLFSDIVFFFLWSVEFIWILIRERCPPGGFNGWCNAYNIAAAGTCLLGLVFGLGVFFDVKDLHQSRVSPRTRT
ncbi:hypothetical protein BC827DRAFT_1124722 [Russula dissimulans]|nr:hypothetical protein BC827DRAFT_1124722 [Russula dissimulans]